jgi:hypothetical protein
MDNLIEQLNITKNQIKNLEEALETTDINIKIPEYSFLNDMYVNLKTLTNEERNKFILDISTIYNLNPNNKKFNTLRDEQRLFILNRLKEKKQEIKQKIKNL